MVLFALISCSVPLPLPIVQEIEPARGWNGENTVITITGENFFPDVEFRATTDEADLNRGYEAYLESDDRIRHSLQSVSPVSYTELQAVVGSGLAAGTYDLVVQGPSGREGRLENSFHVSSIQADHLAIVAPEIVAEVNRASLLDVQLEDPTGRPVLEDLEVRASVTGAGPIHYTFGAGGLEQQQLLEDGSIVGHLGLDGRAVLELTVATVDTVDIKVEAVDPASAVRAGSTRQVWEPGGLLSVELSLPSPGFVATAGQPFQVDAHLVDHFGNPVTDTSQGIFIRSLCQDFLSDPLVISGSDTYEITLTTATTPDDPTSACPRQGLVVSGVEGQSPPFDVDAAPATQFEVRSFIQAPPLRAGDDIVAFITALDPYRNATLFPSEQLHVTDSVHGLEDLTIVFTGPTSRTTVARTTIAGDSLVLSANVGPIEGESQPYNVLAKADAVSLELDVSNPIVAGEETRVVVRVYDEYGNVIDVNDLAQPVSIESEAGHHPCVHTWSTGAGESEFLCRFTEATHGMLTGSTVGSSGVVVGSAPTDVVNAPIALVELDVPHNVIAGEVFLVNLRAFDAYGNAYIIQDSVPITLLDATGVPSPVVFGPDGTSLQAHTLLTAGLAHLRVERLGTELAISPPISVGAAAVESLRVTLSESWAFVGESFEVKVEAVDAYGNRGDLSSTVTLQSVQSAGPDVLMLLVNGSSTTTFEWGTPAIEDVIVATGGGFHGETDAVDVFLHCGASGPSPVLDFAGAPSGRACFSPGAAPAEVTVSFAQSTPGDSALHRYSVRVEEDALVRSDVAAFNIVTRKVGESVVRGVLSDLNSCGVEVHSSIWAGPDDGQPVGPVPASPMASTLAIGDTTAIQVAGAVDCTGDPAANALLQVRSDRGRVLGLLPTGEGLVLPLDSVGNGVFTFDAQVATGGAALVQFQSPSLGAEGAVHLQIDGDDQAPIIWNQDPWGATSDPVDHLTLEFSEPVLPSTVNPTSFGISGAPGAQVVTAFLVDPVTVQVGLDQPLDPSLGPLTLQATSELRDLAGNRLSGSFSGVPGDFFGVFGGAGGGLDDVTCSLSPARFRPDGDDGHGEEADTILFQFTATAVPEWWVVRVDDSAGDRVYQRHLTPVGPSDSWTWDGRDQTGRVVIDGLYTLRVESQDGAGNRSLSCSALVSVDNDE